MDVITIIVKTLFEVPKVIIQSTCKTAEVVVETSQSAGSVIVGLIFFIVLLILGVRGCVYVVETHIIKGINPDYKTSFEIAEEKTKEKKRKEEEENEKRKAIEKQKERVAKSIRERLGREYSSFILSDYCIIDNCIWASGSMIGTAPLWGSHGGRTAQNTMASAYYPLVLFSEDYGKNYKIQWENRPVYAYHGSGINNHNSKITFSDKNNGCLTVFFNTTPVLQYKTKNGGRSWENIPYKQ